MDGLEVKTEKSFFEKSIMARNKKIEISVIIVNYNVRDFLSQCLHSVKKAAKGIPSEIIVVDNASDDGSAEMVRKKYPDVKLILNNENLGFAKANNIALKEAKGQFLLLLNPDTILQEDTIRVMLGFMKTRREVGLAGCKIINPDGSFDYACRRSFPTPWIAFTKITGLSKLFPKTELFGKYNLTYLSTEETYPVDAVSGSFMMVRREVLKEVGGLDERFFMYGEDLDWCYRIKKAGWQIYYVHSTQIIHYRGQSTKRSNIDEIKAFYEAMRIFVEKHYKSSLIFLFLLKLSIKFLSILKFLAFALRPLRFAIVDFFVVTLSLLIGKLIRTGTIFHFPEYAYVAVFTVPALIVITSLYIAGVYTHRYMSISRSITATFVSYVIISALVAFFKQYAFSRVIIIISGFVSLVLVPGWRILIRIFGRRKDTAGGGLIEKRTLIVGTNKEAKELCKKLKMRVDKGYDLIGFIGNTHKDIGKSLNGVKVLGSLENIGKVIREQKITDVIFAPKSLNYTQMLSIIGKCKDQPVSFNIVPSTLDVVVGGALVDSLNDVPLISINYNINKPFHVFTKRLFDILMSVILLVLVYPILWLLTFGNINRRTSWLRMLPLVLKGEMSMVGPPVESKVADKKDALNLGKPGLFGLPQLQRNGSLSKMEINQYNIYYARNQSLLLDFEILVKSLLKYRRYRKMEKMK